MLQTEIIHFRVEKELANAVRDYAKDTERTIGGVIRMALKEYLKNHPIEGDE